MNKPALPVSLVAAVILLCLGRVTSAAPISIVDQQNLSFDGSDSFLADDVSQSFTPILTGIDAIELMLARIENAPDVRLDLYEGDGTGGTLLGSSNTVTLTDFDFALAHFDFASTIALAPGGTYTFQIKRLADDSILLGHSGAADTYAGGVARDSTGSLALYGDIYFVEGLHAVTTPVPEPTSMALFGLGALSIGVGFRRRGLRRQPLDRVV